MCRSSSRYCDCFTIFLGTFCSLAGLLCICLIIAGSVCLSSVGRCTLAKGMDGYMLGGGVIGVVAVGLCGGFIFFGPD